MGILCGAGDHMGSTTCKAITLINLPTLPPKLPIFFLYLKEVCFPFTVASSKSSINRGGNTPNFCDPPGWGWRAERSEHPEIMT